MTKNSKLSQEMIDANKIARAKQKIASLGLDPEDIMPKLQAKMGQYACDFVFQAMRYPGELCNRTGETFQKSRALISTYANEDISDERLAKALGAKTKKEAEAKSIKIQESKVKYLAKRDLQALVNNDVADIQQEAAEKQKQAELRITSRSAVLIPAEQVKEPKSAVLEPAKTKAESTQTQTPTPQSTGFKLEPLAPDSWQAASLMTAPTEPEVQVPLDSRRIAEEEARAKAAAEEPVIEGSQEAIARQKAQEELAKLKEGKTGELTFEELMQAGVSKKDDMPKVITKNNFGEVHAGPTAKKIADKCKPAAAVARRITGQKSGWCAMGYGIAERDTTGIKYQDKIVSLKKNGSNVDSAWDNMKNRVVFNFDSDKKNGNPEILTCDIGTSVNFDGAAKRIYGKDKRGRKVLLTQPGGHVSTKGVDNNWYSDHHDANTWLAGTGAAKRYGDTYNVSWYIDCTISDKLAEDMLYQKYLREEREKMTTKVILAQNELDK